MKIYNIKAPSKIYTAYLNAPQEYRDKLVETTYKLKLNNSNSTPFKSIFDEDKVGKIIATSFKAWEDDPIYLNLLNNILSFVKTHIIQENHDQYKLYDAWAGVYSKNQHTLTHGHIPATYSYCYYIKALPPYTPMVFDDCNLQIEAKTDLLIVFPSYLYHSVPSVKGKERVFVAGNIIANWK